MEKLYDIEFELNDVNHQETGLTIDEAEERLAALKDIDAENIRLIER